jgi:hypothetical protein
LPAKNIRSAEQEKIAAIAAAVYELAKRDHPKTEFPTPQTFEKEVSRILQRMERLQ